MRLRAVKPLWQRALSCALAVVLVSTLTPALAWAIEEGTSALEESSIATATLASVDAALLADGTVSCGNGWSLYYTIDNGGATITGVAAEGSGSLSIPSTISGTTVVAIANDAFSGCTSLTDVSIPSSVESIGVRAFLNSSVTSVNIPAAVTRIAYRCFRGCTSLTSVTFEGSSLRYLSQQAFYGCTSLTEIEIPLLTDTPTLADMQEDGLNSGAISFGASIGASCFANCSSLKRIVFNGPVLSDTTKYFANSSCLVGCPTGLEIVCKGAAVDISAASTLTFPSSLTLYYTLDFYNSESDAANYTNKVASITLQAEELARQGTSSSDRLASTYLIQIIRYLNGAANYKSYVYEDSENSSIPTCPSGKVWALVVNDDTSLNEYSYLVGSYQVVAVDPEDVSYGWISSPTISEFNSTNSSSSSNSASYPVLSMEADGSIPELSQIAVYAADGSKLSSSAYTLVFEKATTTSTTVNGSITSETTWAIIDQDDITDTGLYRVSAVGTGTYASSSTSTVLFYVSAPSPDVVVYDGDSMSAYLGTLAYNAALSLEEVPAYNVVVPLSDWRNQLLGAAFAGAGGGILLTDCGSDYSATMMQAAIQTQANAYIIIGSRSDVPQSNSVSDEVYLADFVIQRTGTYGTRYGTSATTAQELASEANSTFKAANWGAAWGEIAVVASSTDELITEAAAQYIYQNAARVYFLQDDGTIADEDLTALAASGVSSIVLIGDNSTVSTAVEEAIASSTGITPQRILEGDTAGAASLLLAQQLVASGGSSFSTIVIADATESANVSNAAILAEVEGGVMLVCRTSADAKAIEAFLESLISEEGWGAVSQISLVGSFDYLDDASSYFVSAWSVAYSDLNTTGALSLEVGDTFEVDGYIYRITGSTTANLIAYTGGASSDNAPEYVTYKSVTYTVTITAVDFIDMPSESSWSYDYIVSAVQMGLMTGYRDDNGNLTGYFGTSDGLTRAQAVVVLYRAMTGASDDEVYVENQTPFTDLAAEASYYNAALNWAYEQGIITGYIIDGVATNEFNPDATISRQEMALLIWRVAGSPTASDLSAYNLTQDAGSEWAEAVAALQWTAEQGILSGYVYNEGSSDEEVWLLPYNAVTREQAAKIYVEAYKFLS